MTTSTRPGITSVSSSTGVGNSIPYQRASWQENGTPASPPRVCCYSRPSRPSASVPEGTWSKLILGSAPAIDPSTDSTLLEQNPDGNPIVGPHALRAPPKRKRRKRLESGRSPGVAQLPDVGTRMGAHLAATC